MTDRTGPEQPEFPYVRRSDPEALRLRDEAKVGAKQAQALLAYLGERLRGEGLDRETMNFLADAFERASKGAPSRAAHVLATRLHLSATHRRPVANEFSIARRCMDLLDAGEKLNEAREICAGEFGIDARTVARYLHKLFGTDGPRPDAIKKATPRPK
jgi:hypothetical protein